jgi:hypothetical protein
VNRPCKVTAVMASPICGHVPMLDALLCSWMGRFMPSILGTLGGHKHAERVWNGYQNIPIPIASKRIGGWMVPQASSPIYRIDGEDVANITRVSDFDLDAMKTTGANKINVTSGSFKGMRLPKRVMAVERVVWFAVARVDGGKKQTAPMSRLRKAVRKIESLGGKHAVGFGVVAEWIVEPMDDDWSWFAQDADGSPVLMRPLPMCDELPSGLVGHKQWFGRPAQPYYDNSTAVEIVVPC